jgi:hypothetical protein
MEWLRRVGENEMASAVKVIGRNARPPTQRHQKIGRDQHVIGAAVRAADTAQYEPELRNGKKGRFEERDAGLGIDA